MSPLTLKLIQVGFLVLLWLMVLSVAAVMRGDLYARRRTKPPKPPKRQKARKPPKAPKAAKGAAATTAGAATPGVAGAAGLATTGAATSGLATSGLATSGLATVEAASAAAAATSGRPPKPPKPPKPRRGAARTLAVTAGTREGTTLELGASPITIGRLPENTLVLEDDYVSGRHARLYPHEGAWVVEDLGSTNGTYLDRTRLTAPVVLPVGTPVRIGKTVLELRK